MQPSSRINIRPIHQRDFYAVQQLGGLEADQAQFGITSALNHPPHAKELTFNHAIWLSWFRANRPDRIFVAELDHEIVGMIWVAAFNRSRSTWQIERMAIAAGADYFTIGTDLIRYALGSCWEARTWLLQVNVQSNQAIALYRQNGFQPLAHLTNWQISQDLVDQLAASAPELPNLLPINNADATLLYQLDTAAMPPQIRQVYDLGVSDFRLNFWTHILAHGQHLLHASQEVSGYVYESQRKAAIGYFSLLMQPKQGNRCHMTIHPAYTWLYPAVIAQVAKVVAHSGGDYSFVVSSTDYQPEREAYLEQIQAQRFEHGLLMGRSVWHKVRESRISLESLQLSRVLAGLQPVHRPVPGRIDTPPSGGHYPELD
ncbi:MAG: GNAT family N-acetyltransferase [Pseudanabaenaceae cyanobacterium bins.68]|nr:GNAT family N-acetyltransferase [Pseudanabaenaceae cyanobacterium bins.68]